VNDFYISQLNKLCLWIMCHNLYHQSNSTQSSIICSSIDYHHVQLNTKAIFFPLLIIIIKSNFNP